MITKFTDWREVISGLYCYIVSQNIRYEIHIEYHVYSTDILTAKASLYIVCNDSTENLNNNYYRRVCILPSNMVQECISEAYKHSKERGYL